MRCTHFESLEAREMFNTYTVNTVADGGTGSLRWAIGQANSNVGADTINFNIPGGGLQTITPATPFADITGPTTINGYSQPGSSANTLAVGDNAVLRVRIDGMNVTDALVVSGASTTIRGLSIVHAGGAGISLTGGTGHVVAGNFIGVNPDGTAAGNNVGVNVGAGATIGGPTPADRNVISANASYGIQFAADGEIRNNYIGTTPSGLGARGNGALGIRVGTNRLTVADNVIAANGSSGLWAELPGANVTIRNNRVGVGADGNTLLGNNGAGLSVDGANAQTNYTIEDNIVAANAGSGISATAGGWNVRNFTIRNNRIGLTLGGTNAPNGGDGIHIGGEDHTITGNTIRYGDTGDGVVVEGYIYMGLPFGVHGFRARILNNIITGGPVGQPITLINGGTAAGMSAYANHGQAAPVITSATTDALTGSTIVGQLTSTPNHTYTIEIYSTIGLLFAPHQMAQRLGTLTVTTNAAGFAPFSFSAAGLVRTDAFITATATDITAGSDHNGDTSELSNSLAVRRSASAATYLSDLTPFLAENGWGPYERDHSNGEMAAGDGRTINLNGTAYAKGLGVHARSDLRYDLGGRYSHFLADVGLDDEVAKNGSVQFLVYVDGGLKPVFNSGLMRGGSTTQHVDVDVTGVNELRLVVLDGGDGNGNDHADWANARLTAPASYGFLYQVPEDVILGLFSSSGFSEQGSKLSDSIFTDASKIGPGIFA